MQPAEAKGLLQTYARFLNLNTDLLLVQFADALQERLAEKAAAESKPRKRARLLSPRWVALRRFFTLDLFFGTLLVGGIIFFMVWGAAQLMNQPEPQTETTNLPEIQEILIGSQTPMGIELTQTPTEEAPAFQLPTATPLSVLLDTTAPIQVVVHARQSVWVKVNADNEEVYQGRMPAGSVEAYTAKEYLELEAGNAAALEIVYNQTQLDPFSRVGQLLRLRFDANGMQDLSATPPFQPTHIDGSAMKIIPNTFHLISLGCAKNLVDSQGLWSLLSQQATLVEDLTKQSLSLSILAASSTTPGRNRSGIARVF